MKIDYDVGDVVVCIDDARLPGRPSPSVKRGKLYRVIEIEVDDHGHLCVNVDNLILDDDWTTWWHCATRFKKLPKADDQFTAMIRKTRQKEDA